MSGTKKDQPLVGGFVIPCDLGNTAAASGSSSSSGGAGEGGGAKDSEDAAAAAAADAGGREDGGNPHVFPQLQFRPHATADFANHPENDGESGDLAAALDREARGEAARALLSVGLPHAPLVRDVYPETDAASNLAKFAALARKLDALGLRSSEPFMAAVVGHLPYLVLQRLVTFIFFPDEWNSQTCESAGHIEALLFLLATADRVPPCPKYPTIRLFLMNSDALHQSLLRSTRAAVRDFSSPHANTEALLPAFPVFGSDGKAQSTFRRRPLDPLEARHPYLPRRDYTGPPERYTRKKDQPERTIDSFGKRTDVPFGECSVVPTLKMFQRAFRIFTSGLLEKVGLARDKAVVAGGAVAACLHPWPSDILALWEEEVASTALIRSGLGKLLPPEIALAIDRSAEWTAAKKLELDRKLFEHLCGKTSAYSSSDIDIFFVCPTGSVDVNSACQTLPMVHKSILRNREAVDLRRILNKNDHKGHWVFTELNDWGDWFRVKVYGSKTPEGLRGKSSREYEREREKTDDDGWSPVMEESMRSRFKLLWTVRTTNSITVTGLHPVRHTQLMLPVVRAAEQVIYPFDLDCVAVFYDGSRVYASPRSLRAFNTRANFADLRSIQDRARALRMVKYGNRGFATVAFEICRHHPRCDVIVAANVRDMLARAFPKSVTAGGRKPVDPDNDEAYPVRFDPDDGNADLEPPLKSIGMDYTPAPLLFGPYIGASELHEQITTFARGWYPINGDENRYFTPLVKKMPHSLTKDAAVFSSTLLESDGSFIPMQFKFVKDDWLARRIRFATALHLCYICKKDTGNSMEIEANDDQSPEDQEGPSPMNFDENSDEDASQEKTSPKSTARRIALCKSCAELNARKRAQSIDLSGKVAIVTGGRIKIGRQVVLKLLRMGAEVHTTTRFPLLLLANLKAEPDSEKWWSRLKVYGLDLSEIPAILALCSYWSRNLPKLDMLIQNAAQTIRRPSEYYEPMVRAEAELTRTMDSKTMAALAFPDGQDGVGVPTIVGGDRPLVPLTQIEPKWISDVARRLSIEPNSSLSSSALRSLITFDDAESFDASVPRSTSLGAAPTVFDPLGPEPTDTRTVTTWTQSISTVPTSEMAIVTLVNCLSPAILLQKLQGLLSSRRKPSGDSSPSFVVNVSSREGSFAPSGQDGMSGGDFGGGDTGGVHPHTNMAKAGLNRLTQSVAGDLATEGIHVVAVDPGWVSVMGPETGVRDETTRGSGRGIVKDSIVPPLTDEDGAARVLDPVIQGLRDGVFFRGVLLRNFVVSTW